MDFTVPVEAAPPNHTPAFPSAPDQPLPGSQTVPVRHQRTAAVTGIGPSGIEALLRAHVVIAGLGGLGTTVALQLVSLGIGRVTLIDPDIIAESNLARQILFTPADIGQKKVAVAHKRLAALNPVAEIEARPIRLTATNAAHLIAGADVVVDCLDDFGTKRMLTQVAAEEEIPVVWGIVAGMYGQVSVFPASGSPSLAALHPRDPAEATAPAGVLGSVAAQIGALQATEVVKLLTGAGEVLCGQVAVLDARTGDCRVLPFAAQ